ncbi:MAG: helix-turn-helix domain-containing protein [bacterium]|nr:helix-turn-helix domain-containing protein [bacterium]
MTTTPGRTPRFLSFPEAAGELGVTESWLRRSATAKKVPFHKVGREIRFTEDDLASIVSMTAVPADSP